MSKGSSTNKKGDALEKAVKEILLRVFPFVEGPPVKTAWQRRDYFTLFDFMVADKNGVIIGIQVSSRPIYDRDRRFKEAWKVWPGYKVFNIDPDKLLEQIVDERRIERLS